MTNEITFEFSDFDKLIDVIDAYFCCENDYEIKISKEQNTFYLTIIIEEEPLNEG